MAERVPHEIPRFDKIAGAILNAAGGDPEGVEGRSPTSSHPCGNAACAGTKKHPA